MEQTPPQPNHPLQAQNTQAVMWRYGQTLTNMLAGCSVIVNNFPTAVKNLCPAPFCTPVGLLHMALVLWHFTYALSLGDSVTKACEVMLILAE